MIHGTTDTIQASWCVSQTNASFTASLSSSWSHVVTKLAMLRRSYRTISLLDSCKSSTVPFFITAILFKTFCIFPYSPSSKAPSSCISTSSSVRLLQSHCTHPLSPSCSLQRVNTQLYCSNFTTYCMLACKSVGLVRHVFFGCVLSAATASNVHDHHTPYKVSW